MSSVHGAGGVRAVVLDLESTNQMDVTRSTCSRSCSRPARRASSCTSCASSQQVQAGAEDTGFVALMIVGDIRRASAGVRAARDGAELGAVERSSRRRRR